MLPEFLMKAVTRTTVFNKERLEEKGCRLYIPNHTSLLDAVMLAVHLPKDVVFVANTQIAKDYAWAMKGREVLSVNPMNPYSVRDMLKVLRSGKSLVIFPEGKITVTNNLMKIYPGVAYLSIKTGVPLVPIAINGGEKAKFFTYIEGKIPTHYFPKTSMYIGEPFTIPVHDGMLMREKKAWGKHVIYRKLQETLFESRMPNDVHLVSVLQERAKEAPNLVIAEEMNGDGMVRLKMKDLWLKVVGLSNLLNTKLSNADKRVGVLMPTAIATMTAVFALLKDGRTPAMLNSSMDISTLRSCLRTGEILTIVTSHLFIEKAKMQEFVKACPEINFIYLEDVRAEMTKAFEIKTFLQRNKKVTSQPSDILLFTSGSEGTPKGVLLTHKNIYANLQQARLMVDFTSQDKIANALPMFHSFGLILSFLSPLCLVPTVLIQSPLMYKAIPEITYDRNATILFGTSTFLSAYGRYADEYDFARLRFVYSGAEKLQDHVKELWFKKFGKRVYSGYGLTETAPILALQTQMLYKEDSVGCFVPGVKFRIEKVEGVEEGGKLLIQAPNLMKGYLLADKGFQPTEEWFDTGDIVTMDQKGFVTIQGRAKRFVKIAGEMVSLSVVEENAKKAIGEGEVCAIRITDHKKGERIELVVTSDKPDAQLLGEYLKQNLRDYWKQHNISSLSLPSHIHIQKSIPLLGSGKTDFTTLTKQIQSLYE